MSASILTTRTLYDTFVEDFDGGIERVGFFLADYRPATRQFALASWRSIDSDGYELRNDFHVSLKDEIRPEIIKWAWDEGASLVEVHSHGPRYAAAFSWSDVAGLREWVPHLWWRLRHRPYAAIVTAGETFDALAWIEGPTRPEQVTHLEVAGELHRATGLTLGRHE